MNIFIANNQQRLVNFAQQNDIAYLGVFGSYSRNQETVDSDIDFLVEFNKPSGLLRRSRVKILLEDLLGKNVDLISKKSMGAELISQIEDDLISIYEKP